MFESRLLEVPPTAGLPLAWRDFIPSRHADLEGGLARWLGVPAVQVESSGTACLRIAFETLKTLSGRRTVIVPAYTCPLVALAVASSELQLRLCDVRPDSFELDLGCLKAACGSDTLCVVPTHLGGLASDVTAVADVARAAGAYVLEDAAQALGTRMRGHSVGTTGDIGMFSLTRGKGLTLYEGGFLVACDTDMMSALRETSRRLTADNPAVEWLRCLQLLGYRLTYNPVFLRLVYGIPLRYWLRRGDPVRAVGDFFPSSIALNRVGRARKAVAASALARLPMAIEENAKRGRQRAQILTDSTGVSVLQEPSDCQGTWPFLMVIMPSGASARALLDKLWMSGLGVTRLFAHELSKYEYLRTIVPAVDTPNASSLSERLVTISNSPWLSDADFATIVREVEAAIA